MRTGTVLGTLVVVVALAFGCGGTKSDPSAVPPPRAIAKDVPPGLTLRVSNGKAGKPAYDRANLAPATKLAPAEVTQLLARTKPLTREPADLSAFAIRPGSQPPPRTGQVMTGAFPPPPTDRPPPAAAATGKGLSVVRWMPEGEVPLAPELSITFSQPMIAVTSQEDAAKVQPVQLQPTPKGRWRWIGTRTIVFDPEVRFPQATTYTVTIPAGTKSATGEVLPAAKTFSFETPGAKLVSSYPASGPQQLDAPTFLLFDQKIDPQAVLAKLTVTANGRLRATRLVDAAELEKAHEVKALVAAAKADQQDGRWVVLRTTDKLPGDAEVFVELGLGTPSAEGPNTTKFAQRFSFRTYPPLKLVEATCGWGGNTGCRPRTPVRFELNNSLDVDAFDPSQVTVTPALPDLKVYASGTSITITGTKHPRTGYVVSLAGKLKDEFGQTLGGSEKRIFLIGDPETEFLGPSDMVVLDPMAPGRTLDFFTTSYRALKVQLYKVTPADYDRYGTFLSERWNNDKPAAVPGRLVFDDLVPIKAGQELLTETHVDLSAALDAKGFGHVIAIIQPSPWTESSRPPELISWVQATRLGIDVHLDSDTMHAYASELDSGKPAADVQLELRPAGVKATSDDTGLAAFALAAPSVGAHYLVARRDGDVAFVTENNGWYSSGTWDKRVLDDRLQLQEHVLDDRTLYRPGEEVSIKGWMRWSDRGKGGDVGPLDGALTGLTFRVVDAQDNEIAKGTTTVSALGGFDAKFTLPKTPNLGRARIEFSPTGPRARPSYGFSHDIRVEEFRRPEFEVKAAASDGPFVVGGGGDVTVSAKYFTGAALPGAQVTWAVSASTTSFTPPNRDDYQFGAWHAWWSERFDGYDGDYGGYDDDEAYLGGRYRTAANRGTSSWSLEGKTDAVGEHTLHLEFLSANPATPMSVTTAATVTDVNRQTWSTQTSLVVHPSSLYVGLKAKRPFVEKGTPFELDVIGVDLDGKLVTGSKISLTAVRLEWTYAKGSYRQQEVEPQACAVTIAAAAGTCTFQTAKGGQYAVTATIIDDKGRQNQSKLQFTVSGGEDGPPSREVSEQRVELIPDKQDYSPGNTAEVLIQTPFYPAEGVLSWRRSGIVKLERITLDGPTKIITVPITDAMTPNLFVRVDLVGMAVRANDQGQPDPAQPKRPAFASGSVNLAIPPRHRTLAITVTPAAPKVSPAGKTSLAVEIRDAAGKPVADAEAAVIVVDEAILALANAQFGTPIDTFYAMRGIDSQDRFSRSDVKLAKLPGPGGPGAPPPPKSMGGNLDPEDDAERSAGSGTAMALEEGKMGKKDEQRPGSQNEAGLRNGDTNLKGRDGIALARNAGILGTTVEPAQNTPIAVRSNFNPLAAFVPQVKTDANGKATVEIAMPDNLTRYRVIVIAVAGARQFGKGESAITARLPLMVRPSPPRFLNFGDTFQLPVVVQNQTDAPMTVRLAIAATNLALTDGTGRSVTVPANDRVEVQFSAAAELAGTARIQIVGSAGANSDAAELAIPVWTPATTEAFATYGVIDDGAMAQPIALPGKVVPTFGGLEITAASTNLQALTDAMLYLVHYPFDCAEQRSSRMLAIAALRDVLEAFKVKDMPSRGAMEASITADLAHLAQMQNADGGFAYWERNYPSEPYLSVHVASALARARAKGYAVPTAMVQRALGFLRDIEAHYTIHYSPEVRRSISAYALYVRKLLGDLDIAKGQRLIADAGGVEKLAMETNGWLLSLFAGNPAAAAQRTAIVRHALSKVSETAGAANFTTSYGDGSYLLLASDRRVDAVMLEALILEKPDLDLIPKLVAGLLAHRSAGHWLNTQENAFALLALDLYFQTYEKVTPNFVARVWLGNDAAGELPFRGRSTTYFQINVPMTAVAAHDKQALTIQKDGAGRLYYRIGMTYAPASLSLAAADYGFVVERTYEGIDDPKDVRRGPDAIWHLKAGARVRVKLSMVNENRRYHVALVDPLPAGLEILNPALAGQPPLPRDASATDETSGRGAYGWWDGPWYEHQNLRDERAEAFTQELAEGVHAYEYVTRATTPGTFVVPPPKAEEMYMPETFGRGASDKVIVE